MLGKYNLEHWIIVHNILYFLVVFYPFLSFVLYIDIITTYRIWLLTVIRTSHFEHRIIPLSPFNFILLMLFPYHFLPLPFPSHATTLLNILDCRNCHDNITLILYDGYLFMLSNSHTTFYAALSYHIIPVHITITVITRWHTLIFDVLGNHLFHFEVS